MNDLEQCHYSPPDLANITPALNSLINNDGGEKNIFEWWDDGTDKYPTEYYWKIYRKVSNKIAKQFGEPIEEGASTWKYKNLLITLKTTYHDAGTIIKMVIIVTNNENT